MIFNDSKVGVELKILAACTIGVLYMPEKASLNYASKPGQVKKVKVSLLLDMCRKPAQTRCIPAGIFSMNNCF
jgi:hypothetical protein